MEGVCVQQVERDQLLALPRLFNHRMLELRQQFLSRPKKSRDSSLRQNLFGKVEAKENIIFAQEELNKMSDAASRRWNFDIDAGVPLQEKGQYHWRLTQETQQALDTSGRVTCLSAYKSSSPNNGASSSSSSSGFASSSAFRQHQQQPQSSFTSPSQSPTSSPNSKRGGAVTNTTFSTTTTPTAVISNKKCLKRLQKSGPSNNKVPKLITDYFKESKPVVSLKTQQKAAKDIVGLEEKDCVSNRLVEILKIRSMNVR